MLYNTSLTSELLHFVPCDFPHGPTSQQMHHAPKAKQEARIVYLPCSSQGFDFNRKFHWKEENLTKQAILQFIMWESSYF